MTCVPPGQGPRVSVVVPTYRRNDLLRRCLAALAGQDFDPSLYEVIVVDDAADDETRALVEGWARKRGEALAPTPAANGRTNARSDRSAPTPAVNGLAERAKPDQSGWTNGRASARRASLSQPGALSPRSAAEWVAPGLSARDLTDLAAPPGAILLVAPEDEASTGNGPHAPGGARLNLRYLPVTGPAHGPAVARNLGWRAACGEIIAFTDDDCIPAPGWLRAGCEAFDAGAQGAVIGVSGRVIVPLAGTPTDYELDATGLERSEFVTANCFYRREALAGTGGFDERFAIAWREDSDLFFTLLSRDGSTAKPRAGQAPDGRFRHAPAALVIHPIRPAPRWVSLRQQRKNFYNALLYKKHPALYRERLGARTPWRYYAIVAALVATPAALAAHQEPTALSAGLLWFVLTARFCGQRLATTSHAAGHVAEMALTSALIPPLAIFWRLAGAVKYRVWFL